MEFYSIIIFINNFGIFNILFTSAVTSETFEALNPHNPSSSEKLRASRQQCAPQE